MLQAMPMLGIEFRDSRTKVSHLKSLAMFNSQI
jgi:hypothetical protein